MPILPWILSRLWSFRGNRWNNRKLPSLWSIVGSKTGVADFSNFAKSLNVNKALIKQLHSRKQIRKESLVVLSRRWCACWWWLLLEMLKKHLYVIRSLSREQKFTIQQYGALCHTVYSVTNCLNENVPDYIRKEKWFPNSCDRNLFDYAIWDIMKKILYKNVKRYEDIEGHSAAILYVWDRMTKKFINNSIDQWRMWLEKVVEKGGDDIVHLIWQHWLMILCTFL